MSKIITIPTDRGRPFVVMVNGTKHIYIPGETVEVPDGVALEIEEAIRWGDKYEKPVTPPIGIDAVLAEAKKYTDSQRLAYEEPAVMGKVFECVIPAGQNNLYFDAPEGFSFVEGIPVTINGITIEADYAYANEGVHFQCGDYLYIEGMHYWNNEITGQMRVEAYDPNGKGIDVDRHVSIDVDVVVKDAVVHTIEPKFLPGVCLPMLDICGFYGGDVTDEKTIQFLNEVANSELPFILKFEMNGHTRSTFMHYCGYGEQGVVYESVQYSDMTTISSNSDGVWNIYISAGA